MDVMKEIHICLTLTRFEDYGLLESIAFMDSSQSSPSLSGGSIDSVDEARILEVKFTSSYGRQYGDAFREHSRYTAVKEHLRTCLQV